MGATALKLHTSRQDPAAYSNYKANMEAIYYINTDATKTYWYASLSSVPTLIQLWSSRG